MRCQGHNRGFAAQPPGQPRLCLDCSRQENSNGCKIRTQDDPVVGCASTIEIIQKVFDSVVLGAAQHGFHHGAFLTRQNV